MYENPVSIYAASHLVLPRINILLADLFGQSPANAPSIGLRAEQIHQGEGERSTVMRIERLGDQTRLHLEYQNHDIVTITDPHTSLKPGDSLAIRPQQPFWFDASGNRLAGENS